MRITNHLAILRNLRNVVDAGVSPDHIAKIKRALTSEEWARGAGKILPFRYVAAARMVPQFEPELDAAMQASLAALPRLPGKTVVLVDVSGSMGDRLSSKSDLTRMDAAAALAVLVRGIAEDVRVFTFSDRTLEVAPRSGMALVDAIMGSQPHHGTYLGNAIGAVRTTAPNADRLIVITDEQSQDAVGGPGRARGYMINVASYENGVGYDDWTRITGFSESVVSYIQAIEAERADVPQEQEAA